MNQFERAAEALETAADELEKVPRQLRTKFLFIGELAPLIRKEATNMYSLYEATKETS